MGDGSIHHAPIEEAETEAEAEEVVKEEEEEGYIGRPASTDSKDLTMVYESFDRHITVLTFPLDVRWKFYSVNARITRRL